MHVAPLNSATNQNLPANPTEKGRTLTAGKLPMVVGGNLVRLRFALPGHHWFASGAPVAEEANIGTSFYNSLQTSVVRRFSKGLTMNFNYVWSHMTDNVDGSRACVLSIFATPEQCWYDQQNGAGPIVVTPPVPPSTTPTYSAFFNSAALPTLCATEGTSICKPVSGWQQGDWGNGAQDVRTRLTWGTNYELPFGKSATGVEGVLLKGWAANTSGSWQTGLPFSVTPNSNLGGISGGGYLDQICNPHMGGGTLLKWYNFGCFVQPTPGTLGRQDPNQVFGPAQKQVSFSLSKEIPIKENIRLQFRTEVFNLFNSVNFNTPSGTALTYNHAGPNGFPNQGGAAQDGGPGSTHTPGEITALNANWTPRQIQFALKLLF